MSDFIEDCTICGKTFNHGDEAYATVSGEISNPGGDYNVFEPLEAPYITVACEACGLKCSEAIANINKKHEEELSEAMCQVGWGLIDSGLNNK